MFGSISISTIYLGNAADIDADESTVTAENADDLLGTYGSDTDPLWKDRVSLETNSPDNDTIWTDNVAPEDSITYDTGAGTIVAGLDSNVTYNITVTFTDGSTTTIIGDVLQTTNGDLFFALYDGNTVLTTKPIASISLDSIDYNDWSGFVQNAFDDNAFVCFTPNTGIDTPIGTRNIQNLKTGDLVSTMDDGDQPITWIGKRTLYFERATNRQKPWEIKAGALGRGQPLRDLVVSPQHHILLQGPDLAPLCDGRHQAITAAKSFAPLKGVRQMHGTRQVTYYSILLERHQIITANGLAVESFFPGPYGLSLLSMVERLQIFSLFPQLHSNPSTGYGPHVRPVINYRKALDLIGRRKVYRTRIRAVS